MCAFDDMAVVSVRNVRNLLNFFSPQALEQHILPNVHLGRAVPYCLHHATLTGVPLVVQFQS